MLKNSNGSVFAFTLSKKKLCRRWRLYVITMPDTTARQCEKVREAILGGADAIQLRDKLATDEDMTRQAKALLRVARAHQVPLIVNDRIAVAKQSGADGLHLGQDDGSLAAAKAVLGEHRIYGRSTHSPEQALGAEKEGFDYIGIGPVFETPTKAGRPAVGIELVRYAAANIGIPFVAIGGIDSGNIGPVRRAGARAVAVVRAVMDAADPRKAARELK